MKTLADYITQYGLSGWKVGSGQYAPLIMMLRDELATPGSTSLAALDREGLEIAFKTLQNISTDERTLANGNLPFFSLGIDANNVPIINGSDDEAAFMTEMDAAFIKDASIVFVHGEKDNPFTQHTDYISNTGVVTKDAIVGTDLWYLESHYQSAVGSVNSGWDLFEGNSFVTSKEIFQNMLELVLQNGIDTPANVQSYFGNHKSIPGVAAAAIQQETKLPALPALSDPASDELIKGYIAYFGRPADPDGMQFWVNAINRNAGDVTGMVNNFGTSSEYRSLYGDSSSVEIVNSLYQHLFNRSAEKLGLEFWANHLDTGALTLSNIAFMIADSAQLSDATIMTEKIEASRHFTASLDTKREVDLYNNEIAGRNASQWLSNISDTPAANEKLISATNDVINALQGDVEPILIGKGFAAVYY